MQSYHTALLHAKMVIIDQAEVLVSSANLNHTHLEKEFNAGIWTNDADLVAEAVGFYDNYRKSPPVGPWKP